MESNANQPNAEGSNQPQAPTQPGATTQNQGPNQNQAYSPLIRRHLPHLSIPLLARQLNTSGANTYDIADAVAHLAEEDSSGLLRPGVIEYAALRVDVPRLAAGLRTTEDAVRRVLSALVRHERAVKEAEVERAVRRAREAADQRLRRVDELLGGVRDAAAEVQTGAVMATVNAARASSRAATPAPALPPARSQTLPQVPQVSQLQGQVQTPPRSFDPGSVWPETAARHAHVIHNGIVRVIRNTGAHAGSGRGHVLVPAADLRILETGVASLDRKLNRLPLPDVNASAGGFGAGGVPGAVQAQQGQQQAQQTLQPFLDHVFQQARQAHQARQPPQPHQHPNRTHNHCPIEAPHHHHQQRGGKSGATANQAPAQQTPRPGTGMQRNPSQWYILGNQQDPFRAMNGVTPGALPSRSTTPAQSAPGIGFATPMTATPQTINPAGENPRPASTVTQSTPRPPAVEKEKARKANLAGAQDRTSLGTSLGNNPVPNLNPKKHTMVHTPGQSPERKRAVLAPVAPQGEGLVSQPAIALPTVLPAPRESYERHRGPQANDKAGAVEEAAVADASSSGVDNDAEVIAAQQILKRKIAEAKAKKSKRRSDGDIQGGQVKTEETDETDETKEKAKKDKKDKKKQKKAD